MSGILFLSFASCHPLNYPLQVLVIGWCIMLVKQTRVQADLRYQIALSNHIFQNDIDKHKPCSIPGGHSNMKVTYKCLPENENRGPSGIRCKISSKRGGHSVWTSKNGGFFGVDSQKWRSFGVQKCNFKAKFAKFLLKLSQTC